MPFTQEGKWYPGSGFMHISVLITVIIFSVLSVYANGSGENKSDDPFHSIWAKRLEIRSNFPDSAEKTGYFAIRHYEELKNYREVAEAHLYLSEIYQYRKPDILRAFDHILEFLKVLTYHPEIRYTNPFIFVNIGNMLFAKNLPDISVAMYRQGLSYADKKLYPGAKITLLQNIAKVYRSEQKFDSSRYYFSKASKELVQGYTMVCAQQLYSLARLKFEMNDYDSALYFSAKTREYLSGMKPEVFGASSENNGTDKQLWHEYMYASMLMQGDAMSGKKVFDGALLKYDSAMVWARLSGPEEYPFTLFIQSGSAAVAYSPAKRVILYGDSAMAFAKRRNDNSMKARAARLLAAGYRQTGDRSREAMFSVEAEEYEAMLPKPGAQEKEMAARLEIASAALGTQLNYLNNTRLLNQKTIEKQQNINRLLATLLLVVIAGGTFIYFSRKRLRMTRFALGRRTAENIMITEKITTPQKKSARSKKAPTSVIELIEHLFSSEKTYIDPELSLATLAKKLGTNKTYLSSLLNSEYGMNFHEFINERRVREACRIIMNDEEHRLSYEQIQSMTGFGSKSTFYVAFKNYTGLNPAEYRRSLKRKG